MYHHTCKICGAAAVAHETLRVEGEFQTEHFCKEHASVMPDFASVLPAAQFSELLKHYQSQSPVERAELVLRYRLERRFRG